MRRSSTLLTRLALALLAVLGFVAPLAVHEADGVVQTAGGKPSAVETQESNGSTVVITAHTDRPWSEPVLFAQAPAVHARRYLLHRAWLL